MRVDGTCQKLLITGGFVRYDVTGWPLCISVAPPFCACISVKCYGRCNIDFRQVCTCACTGVHAPVHAFYASVMVDVIPPLSVTQTFTVFYSFIRDTCNAPVFFL